MSFRVDAFKREYKNNSPEEVKAWLKDHFDQEKACLYLATYKEDDIPSIGFVRKNKFNGYYQQMDNKLHNKAFGMGVYQEGKMQYLWIFGESEIPALMKQSPLYDVCDWESLSVEDERIWHLIYPSDEVENYLYM
jgi:hypothetical protein